MPELIAVALLALLLGAWSAGWPHGAGRWPGRRNGDRPTRAGEVEPLRAARDAAERDRSEALQALAELRGRAADLDVIRAARDAVEAERNAAHRELAELRAVRRNAKRLMPRRWRRWGRRANRSMRSSERRRRARWKWPSVSYWSGRGALPPVGGSVRADAQALLDPVHQRLQRYEEGVRKVEDERRDAFGELKGQMRRCGSARSASRARRPSWSTRCATPQGTRALGRAQLRKRVESCGLSEHADFQTRSASMTGGRSPTSRRDRCACGRQGIGHRCQGSLNDYQDAFARSMRPSAILGLSRHAAAMRAHVNGLGNKSYWNQFEDAPGLCDHVRHR